MPDAFLLGFLLLLCSRHFLNPFSPHAQLQLPHPTKKMEAVSGGLGGEGSHVAVSQTANQVASPSHASHFPPSSTIRVWEQLWAYCFHLSPQWDKVAVLTPLPIACRAPRLTVSFWFGLQLIQVVCCFSFPTSSSVFLAFQVPL